MRLDVDFYDKKHVCVSVQSVPGELADEHEAERMLFA